MFRISPFRRCPNGRRNIPLLVHHFIERFNRRKGERVGRALQGSDAGPHCARWPGNCAASWENVIEHGFILSGKTSSRLEDLPIHMVRRTASRPGGRGRT